MKDHYPYQLEKEYIKFWSKMSFNLSVDIAKKISKAIHTKIKLDADSNINPSENADIQDIINSEKGVDLSPATVAEIRNFYRTLNGWSFARTEEMVQSLQRSRRKTARFIPKILIDPQSPQVQGFQEKFIQINIQLAKDLKRGFIEDISRLASETFIRGGSTKELANQYVQLADVEKSKAQFWARDQIGSAYAEFNSQRFKEAGIPGYIWMTSLDNRVRDSHALLHGQFFKFSDSPPGLTKPGARLPGEDYNCRCRQQPALDETDSLPQSKQNQALRTINSARKRFGQPAVQN